MIKGITKSDSNTLITQCGFQPTFVYVGIGGVMAVTTKAGDTIQITVVDGSWFPGDDFVTINATNTTASGFVGRK